MLYRLTADFIVLLHLLFIGFVILGGFLAWRWRRLLWLHLPAALWGALIELANWTCPLTPMENWFRRHAGQAGYETSFIERYILPIVYPGELPRTVQIALGCLVVLINAAAYIGYIRRRPIDTT